MIKPTLKMFSRGVHLCRLVMFAAVLLTTAAEIQAQRQQGFVGGRYYGWDAARPLHTNNIPAVNVNQSTATNGLMVFPGRMVQVECATPTSGALFELVGFAIGTPSPASYNQFTGSLFNNGMSAYNANLWRRLINFNHDTPVPSGQAAGTYLDAEGMVWLIVNWGEGGNARYEMMLNKDWQLVPRYRIFFRYEISQNPPCEYSFEFLQVQAYKCNGTVSGTSATNGTCGSPSTATLLYGDLKIFNGMPRSVKVLNPQRDTDLRFQISSTNSASEYTVCVGNVSGRNFIDLTRFKCAGDRYVQFEYIWRKGTGNTNPGGITVASTSSGGATYSTVAPNTSFANGGISSSSTNTVNGRRLIPGGAGGTSNSESAYIRLPADAQDGDVVEVRMYTWNACNIPSNTTAPNATDRFNHDNVKSAFIRVVGANFKADPGQVFTFCYPSSGYANDYKTQIYFNGGKTTVTGGTLRYYGSNAAGTAIEGSYFPNTYGTVFNPMSTNIPAQYRLVPNGNAQERTRTYWVRFLSNGGCEGDPVKIVYKVRDDISQAPGITPPSVVSVCAGKEYTYYVQNYVASSGGDAITHQWLPGTGYSIVETADGVGRTTGQWAKIKIDNTVAAPPVISVLRRWTDEVTNAPQSCPTIPAGAVTTTCPSCFSNVSTRTLNITQPPTATLTGGGEICGDVAARQLTITGLSGGTGTYNVTVTGTQNGNAVSFALPNIPNGYTFTVNPAAGTNIYQISEITANAGNSCVNNTLGADVTIVKRDLLSFAGATITTNPSPPCAETQFTATLAGVTVPGNTVLTWTYNSNSYLSAAGNTSVQIPSAGTATTGVGRPLSVTWRYTNPTADGNFCPTGTPAQKLVEVIQGPTATVAPASLTPLVCEGDKATIAVNLTGGAAGNYVITWALEYSASSGGGQIGTDQTTTIPSGASPATIDVPAAMFPADRGVYVFRIKSVTRGAGGCPSPPLTGNTATITVEKMPAATLPPNMPTTCAGLDIPVTFGLVGEPGRPYIIEYEINGTSQPPLTPSAGALSHTFNIPASYVTQPSVTVKITSVKQEGGLGCENTAKETLTIGVEDIITANPNVDNLTYAVCEPNLGDMATFGTIRVKGNLPADYIGEWKIVSSGSGGAFPAVPAGQEGDIISFTPDLYTLEWTIWKKNDPNCYSSRPATIYFGKSTTEAEVYYREDKYCYDVNSAVQPPYELWALRPAPRENASWGIWKMELDGDPTVYGRTWALAAGSTLPAGLTLSSDGAITGTPSAGEEVVLHDFETVVTSNISNTSWTLQWQITIDPALIGTPGTQGNVPNGEVGKAYNTTLMDPTVEPMPAQFGTITDETSYRGYATITEYGKYTYRWAVTGGCGTLYDYTTVEYIPVPVMNPVPKQEWCPEQVINMPDFVAIDPVTGNPVDVNDTRFTYQWAFTGTPMNLPGISGMQHGQFPANRQTPLTNSFAWEKYYINVYANNGTCLSTPTVVEIDLKPKPPKVRFMDDVTEVCADAEVIMTMENNMWESTTYNWTTTTETEGIIVAPATPKYTPGQYRADSEAPPFSFRFKTTNGTSLPIAADFAVAATVNGCTGDLVHLPLTVNPRPVLAAPAGFEYCPYDAGAQKWVETGETTINSSVIDTKYTWVWNGNPVGFTMPAKVTGEEYSHSNKLDRFQVSDNISTGKLGGTMTVTGETYGCVSEPVSFGMWVKPRPNINVPATQSLCPEVQADGTFGGTFPAFILRSSNLADGQVNYAWTMTPPGGGAPVSGTGNTPTPAALAFADNTTGATQAYSWTVTATGAAGSPADGCVSTLTTPFTMNVHPRPVIDITNTNTAVCSGNDGQAFSNITFGTGVVPSSFSWNITQPPVVTGGVITTGAAQMWGSGNQVTFSGLPYNTAPLSGGGVDPYIATITVNATSVNGCMGEPTQTTLAIKQRPVMKTPASIELCSGATQADIPLSTQNGVTPKMYHWQITDPSVWDKGAAALSNATALTSFTAIENTTDPAVKLTTDIDVWAEHTNGCMSDKVKVPLTVRPRLRLTSSTATIVACPGAFVEIPAFTSNVYGTDVSMITWKYTGVNDQDVSAGGSFMTTDAFNNPVGISSGGNIGAFYAAANNGAAQIEGKFTVKVGTHWSESLACESAPVDITVKVNPTPPKPDLVDYDLTVPETPIFCHGTANVSIAFKNVANTTFSWESSDANLTGAASGTSNPLVFAPVNNTTLQLSERSAKITVRAHAGADGKACPSDPLEFPVIIRPVPQINETYPSLLTGCSGTDFNIQEFSLHNRFFASNYDPDNDVNTTYQWEVAPNNASTPDANWSAAELATLPAASGSVNPIPVFTPINTGSNSKTLTLTVTPTYETCQGITKSIDITIHPTPVITGNVDLTKPIEACSGTKFADITLSGGVSGTAPAWNFTSSPITADGELGTTSTVGTSIIKFTGLSKNIKNPEFKVGLKITATSPSGCPAKEINTELVVLQEPVMNAITPNPVILCSEETHTLGAFSISNTATLHATDAFHWSVSGDALWNASPGTSGDVPSNIPQFTTVRNTSANDRSATVTVYANHANGCKSAEETFTVKVRPVLTVTAVNPESVCPGGIIPENLLAANIAADTKLSWSFTDAATTIIDATAAAPLWTGVPASGVAKTPSFKAAANTTGAPLTGTFALTAEYTSGGPACASKGTDSKSFTVTVKPTPDKPVVIDPTDPVSANPLKFAYCHGAAVPAHLFRTALGATQYTSASPGVTFNWDRSSDIGPGAGSGTGDHPPFTAANTVAGQLSEASATIEVYATIEQCNSEKLTYTIAVKPVPKMLPFGDITLCSGATSDLSDPTTSNFKLVSAFANSGPANFKWRISNNWFQDSDLPDPNTGSPAVPDWQNGYLSGASATPPACDFTPVLPAGSTSPTVMTLTVIPIYDLCEGAPATSSITVNPLPVIKIDHQPERPICSGEQFSTISFSSTVASAFSWSITAPPAGTGITTGAAATASTPATRNKIDFPDVTVHTADLSSWVGSSNPYTATVTVNALSTTGSCAASKTFPLQVWQAPVVTPFVGDITACSGETITAVGTPNRPIEFSVSNGASVDSYSWRTTNALTWNLATSTVAAATPPTKTYMPPFTTASVTTETTANVFVTAQAKYTYGSPAVDYFCKSAESAFALTVRPKPEITSAHANQTVCPDEDVIINNFTFNPATVTGAATGGYWKLTGDAVSKNPAHTPPASGSGNIGNFKSADNTGPGNLAGTFTYWAAYSDMAYCKSADKTFTVTVNPTPAMPAINYAQNELVFCDGETLPKDIIFTSTGASSVSWTSVGHDLVGLTGSATPTTGNIKAFKAINGMYTDNRLKPGVATITATGKSAAGCNSVLLNFTITVKPVPQMAPTYPDEIANCSNSLFSPAVFALHPGLATNYPAGAGTAGYKWTVVSLPAGLTVTPAAHLINSAGTHDGSIAPFTPQLPAGGDIVVKVTPWYAGCEGTNTSKNITFKVQPAPVITIVNDYQERCSGITFDAINFSSSMAGATVSWSITPAEPVSGSPATGIGGLSGNSITFAGAAQNTGTSDYNATVAIRATAPAANNGCVGEPSVATLKVMPAPVVAQVANIDHCAGANVAAITFVTVPATTPLLNNGYDWSIDIPAVKTGAPSESDVKSMTAFTTQNTTRQDRTGKVSVTARHSNGCVSSPMNFNITVRPVPEVISDLKSPLPVCPGVLVTLPKISANFDEADFSSPYSGATITWALALSHSAITSPALPLSGTVGAAGDPIVSEGTIMSYNNDPSGSTISGIFALSAQTVYHKGTANQYTCTSPSPQKTFTVTVDPNPAAPAFVDQTLDDPANRVFCNDVLVNNFTFAAVPTGVSIHWISTGDDIGMSSTNGTGNLPSFTTNNSKTDYTAAVANIKATALSSTGAGCSSSRTFDITVQPVAVLRNFGTTEICSNAEYYAGLPTPHPVFEFSAAFAAANGNNAGNASNFTWGITNGYDAALFDPALILPAGGNGYLPDFKPVVTGDDPVDMTLTVTPSWKGCPGTPRDFTVRLHPLPAVAAITPTPVCSGDRFANINLSANIAGSAFAWEILPTPLPAGISTGIILPGSGSTITFGPATNTVQSSYTATLSVTATSQAGCKGAATTASLTIKQKPVMQSLPGLDACSGVLIAPGPSLTTNLAQTEIGSYNWHTDKQSLWDLPVSGTVLPADPNWPAMPDITMFNETNPSGDVAKITVSATHTNGCISDEVSFNITVWPAPVVKPVAIPEYCPETKVTLPVFAASIPGSQLYWESVSGDLVSSYFDTASPEYIGTTGTGAIPEFETLPITGAQAKGTFNLWAVMKYNNNAITCNGNKTPLEVIVNPTPDAPVYSNPNPASDFCDGDKVLSIGFTPVAGVTFSWKKISGDDVGLPTASGNGALPEFTATNTTAGRLGAGRAEIMATAWSAGCASKDNVSGSFTITVKPVPQIQAPTPVELCGNETYPGQAFNLHPDIATNYPGGATAFDWVITGNIPESNLPDNSTGGIPSFTPNDSYLPPNKPQATHPLWGSTPTNMTLSVTPKYAGCDGKPVMVSIVLNPRPVTTIGTNEDNCIDENGLKLYYANGGKGAPGSTFKWELDGPNPPVINGDSYLLSLSFPDDGWAGKLSVIETNRFACQGEKKELPLKLVPSPIVWAGDDFDICYGNVKPLQGQLLNANKLPNHANDLVYEWFPMNGIAPGATDLTPLLTGTGSGSIRLRAYDSANGCWSDPSTVNVTVLRSPVAPMVPDVMLCESDPLMTMTALNVAANETMYWQRMEESSPGAWTPVAIAGSDGMAAVNMKQHAGGLPASLWSAAEVETTIRYQVYRTAAVNAEVCESPKSQGQLKINRTPDAPDTPQLFTYCENDKNPRYELSVTTTGTNIVTVNWYDETTGKYLGSGYQFTVPQPGSSAPATGVYTHEPFYFNAVAYSAANCPSLPAKVPLIIYPLPNAAFKHNLTGGSICPPLPVKFTNQSAGAANDNRTRYIWDFADGNLDTATIAPASFDHFYENRVSSVPVRYAVKMTAFNRYEVTGRDSLTCYSTPALQYIMVNPQVEARFTGPDKGCSPFMATFQSQSLGSPTNLIWNYGDGTQSGTGTISNHTFVNNTRDQEKTHQVQLIAGNSWCSDTVVRPFTLYPQPVASFRVAETAGCQPFNAVFINTSVTSGNPLGGITYTYDFTDGTSETVNDTSTVKHIFTNVGGTDMHMYPELTAENQWGCVSEPYTQWITVFPYLKARFEMEDSVGCGPLAVRFRNGSLGYSSYQYTFGDGAIANGSPSSGVLTGHAFKTDNMYQDKIYNVTLTVRRGNCEDSQTRQVLVYSTPTANFRPGAPYPADYPFPAAPIQVDNLVQAPDADHLTYRWSWTNTDTDHTEEFGTTKSPAPFKIDDWGHFSITQHVTAPNGKCSDSKTITFNIVPPLAKAFFDAVSPDCVPYEPLFVNNSEYAKSFIWDFGDGNTSGDKNPKHTFMKPGTFTVTLTARGYNMVEQTFTREITVHPTPQAGFEVYPNFRWVGQAVTATNYTTHATADGQPYDVWYRWNWGDNSPEDTKETPDPHMYLKADSYDITLTVGTFTAPQCTSVAVKPNAVTLESAGDIILPNAFKPSPSGEPSDMVPVTGYKNYLFFPPVLSATRTYSMRIFNRWGQQIFHTTDRNRGWNGYSRGRLCSEGVYIYKIEGVFETGQSFLKTGDVTLLR